MNVIVLAKGAGMGAWVDQDFAHARQIVYVKESGGFDSEENPFITKSDRSLELSQFILKAFPDTHAIVAGAFDDESRQFFQEHGIALYIATQGSVMELAEKAGQGALSRV